MRRRTFLAATAAAAASPLLTAAPRALAAGARPTGSTWRACSPA